MPLKARPDPTVELQHTDGVKLTPLSSDQGGKRSSLGPASGLRVRARPSHHRDRRVWPGKAGQRKWAERSVRLRRNRSHAERGPVADDRARKRAGPFEVERGQFEMRAGCPDRLTDQAPVQLPHGPLRMIVDVVLPITRVAHVISPV